MFYTHRETKNSILSYSKYNIAIFLYINVINYESILCMPKTKNTYFYMLIKNAISHFK